MPPKAKVKSKEVEDTEMDCTRLFDALSLKFDEMNSNMEKRHGELCAKLQGLEEKTTSLATELKNLKETDLVDMKKKVESKADEARVFKLECALIDLQNRSRRNNIVFWNVPEGSEKDVSMIEFVKNLLQEHMGLDEVGEIEIMRARRTPTTIRKDASKPRPIHVYLLRYSDRQYILANAAKCLKDNQYEGSTLFISDDVTKEVREQHKKLKEKYLDDLRKRDEVEFANVAWSVPAKILYKVKGEQGLRVIQ